MKVKFKDPGGKLPTNLLNLGYSPSADFHLRGRADYVVYGVLIWRYVVHYLIIPSDLTLPNWLPADLFEIVDPTIPSSWYFRFLGENHPSEITIKIGYKEIVIDDHHNIDLIERKEGAIKIFLVRKNEIEIG